MNRKSALAQGAALLFLSAALVAVFEALRLPAALLLGPMLAAIALAGMGGTLRMPASPFLLAQSVIGCLLARNIPLSLAGELLRGWPLFVGGIVFVMAASSALGWLLARGRVLPGSTALWGCAPGGASAMVFMAEAYDADARLVAFMQYLRVVCVAIAATVVARVWTGSQPGAPTAIDWFPPVAWRPFIETLALAAFGGFVAPRLPIPAGPLLLPIAAGVLLQGLGWMTLELPPWLLAGTYAVVGWSIGLRFNRPILVHAARALPRVLAAIVGLIVICAAFGALLVPLAGVDPLTAYLAMSPGGVDSVAIIAASSRVDLPFITAMQTARLVFVLVAGPGLARFMAKRLPESN